MDDPAGTEEEPGAAAWWGGRLTEDAVSVCECSYGVVTGNNQKSHLTAE